MNENLDPTNQNFNPEELDLEKRLRPLSFDDFAGQDQILENLKVFVEAANQRNEALDHTLFHGPPGLGKTTLSHILANELGVGIKITSGSLDASIANSEIHTVDVGVSVENSDGFLMNNSKVSTTSSQSITVRNSTKKVSVTGNVLKGKAEFSGVQTWLDWKCLFRF